MGAITPIGLTTSEYWDALLQGENGIRAISLFDASKFKTRFAGEIHNFDPKNYIEAKEARKMDRFSQLAIAAGEEAIQDAFGNFSGINKDEIGVIWASGVGGLASFEQIFSNYLQGDGRPNFNPFFIPRMIIDISAGLISIRHGLRGPNLGVVSACASSSHALITAMNAIRLGQAKAIVAGGSEASITPSSLGGFNALRALSMRNDDYKTASRPFDQDRDGFVLGEGGACLVLEEYEHARTRGAKIYGALIGAGMSGDAHHLTAPHPEGIGVCLAMRRALKDAKIQATDIDYINAHATSTSLGDVAEVQAIKQVFGEHAKKLCIGATKSMIGHLLGAAGAAEAIACIKSIQTGCVHPTINQFQLDKAIDPTLNYCFGEKQKRNVRVAISNSFGFGGHNATLVFQTMDN